MSDEETDTEDNNALLKQSPTWRCVKLNKLIQKLEQRYTDMRKDENSSQ